MVMIAQAKSGIPTVSCIIVREIRGKRIYLLVAYYEGEVDQVCVQRVDEIPKKYRDSILFPRHTFRYYMQQLRTLGYDTTADTIRAIMDPNKEDWGSIVDLDCEFPDVT